MQFRRFGHKYFVRMDKGEEIMATLEKFCRDEKITLAEVKALGAVSEFEVGLFDINEKNTTKTILLSPPKSQVYGEPLQPKTEKSIYIFT